MKRFLVTGVKGQLGYDIMKVLEKRGLEGVGVDIEEMDITEMKSVETVIRRSSCDMVIHCAAWTAVDAAEDNEQLCRRVNADGTGNIARVCGELDIPMMYFSTDYVFNGKGETPWKPDDIPNPVSVYGRSKLEGENAVRKYLPKKHFILRLQWVYGINGKNFVRTMLKLSETRDRISVVSDQVGGPTYTCDIAKLSVDMALSEKFGTYHAANTGYCSWYEFACKIFELAEKNVEVLPVSSDEYPAKAKRPLNSRLDTGKLTDNGFEQLPPWQDALERYLAQLKAENG